MLQLGATHRKYTVVAIAGCRTCACHVPLCSLPFLLSLSLSVLWLSNCMANYLIFLPLNFLDSSHHLLPVSSRPLFPGHNPIPIAKPPTRSPKLRIPGNLEILV